MPVSPSSPKRVLPVQLLGSSPDLPEAETLRLVKASDVARQWAAHRAKIDFSRGRSSDVAPASSKILYVLTAKGVFHFTSEEDDAELVGWTELAEEFERFPDRRSAGDYVLIEVGNIR